MSIPRKLDEPKNYFIPFSNLIRPTARFEMFMEDGTYKHSYRDENNTGLLKRGNEIVILLVVLSISFVFLYLSSSYSRFLKSFKNEEDHSSESPPVLPPVH